MSKSCVRRRRNGRRGSLPRRGLAVGDDNDDDDDDDDDDEEEEEEEEEREAAKERQLAKERPDRRLVMMMMMMGTMRMVIRMMMILLLISAPQGPEATPSPSSCNRTLTSTQQHERAAHLPRARPLPTMVRTRMTRKDPLNCRTPMTTSRCQS